LAGSLRAPVGEELRQRVKALLGRGQRSILLDLAHVTDLDAAGVGELVHVYRLAIERRAELWIENAVRRVRHLLERAGLFEILSTGDEIALEARTRWPASS
jgi:anti-anti-sigma factor